METFFSPGGADGSGRASRSAYLAWLRRLGTAEERTPDDGFNAEMGSPYGLHGGALRSHFGYRGHGGGALRLGKQSGLYDGSGKLQGSASVHVRFENPPKGMRTKAAASGLFNEVKLSRGRTMKESES